MEGPLSGSTKTSAHSSSVKSTGVASSWACGMPGTAASLNAGVLKPRSQRSASATWAALASSWSFVSPGAIDAISWPGSPWPGLPLRSSANPGATEVDTRPARARPATPNATGLMPATAREAKDGRSATTAARTTIASSPAARPSGKPMDAWSVAGTSIVRDPSHTRNTTPSLVRSERCSGASAKWITAAPTDAAMATVRSVSPSVDVDEAGDGAGAAGSAVDVSSDIVCSFPPGRDVASDPGRATPVVGAHPKTTRGNAVERCLFARRTRKVGGPWRGRRPLSGSDCGSGLADGLGLDLDADRLADEDAAGLEGLVPA